jgi:transcriptional regulator with XRE-family HTH domain
MENNVWVVIMAKGEYSTILAIRLKQARRLSGFTQEEVEEIINISKSSISQYENGKMCPTIDVLGRLAAFYKVSLDWLFGLGTSGNDSMQEDLKTSKEIEKKARLERKLERHAKRIGVVNFGNIENNETVYH